MQFLRTLFWVVLSVIAVVFATRNWTTVPVNLWGGLVADVKLPVLLGGAFLLGLVPPFVLYRATRWQLRRRLDQAQRTIAAQGEVAATPPAPVIAPVEAQPLPPQTPVVP
ncbi:lipopolysaccharide assembly protein LapA domain-containing protein [Sphingomonas jatrophae]|uniref:Lipopolysaccharide assembly protein A domain-containing protein n=1 Tax=Sphingomonas jatrophae TaxID=1166337 RepID=A0A1I6JST7_9SPHN|nr:lipopolysaccharide assembly protein LapA domain-containing protein [Sphingomonas jatrophae]SFR82039.1 Protein of unknown function [Sphingomonas jatrophae]